MLDSLITSKTRIKLLLKFFLNPSTKAYLRGLADEFGESTNAIRLELNHLEEAGLLQSDTEGNKKIYQANTSHPLFKDIHSLVLKHSGITQVIEQIIIHLGVYKAWIIGDCARGIDSDYIELVVEGRDIDLNYFTSLIPKVEKLIHRRITYVLITPEEEELYVASHEKALVIWKK